MYLDDYKPEVTFSDGKFIVDYGIGECHYVLSRIGIRIKQKVLQLIKCDMWKVITEINEKSPLQEGDLTNLNLEIREHSRRCVMDFINEYRPHQ